MLSTNVTFTPEDEELLLQALQEVAEEDRRKGPQPPLPTPVEPAENVTTRDAGDGRQEESSDVS